LCWSLFNSELIPRYNTYASLTGIIPSPKIQHMLVLQHTSTQAGPSMQSIGYLKLVTSNAGFVSFFNIVTFCITGEILTALTLVTDSKKMCLKKHVSWHTVCHWHDRLLLQFFLVPDSKAVRLGAWGCLSLLENCALTWLNLTIGLITVLLLCEQS